MTWKEPPKLEEERIKQKDTKSNIRAIGMQLIKLMRVSTDK